MKQRAESLIFIIYMDPLLTNTWFMILVKVATAEVIWKNKTEPK